MTPSQLRTVCQQAAETNSYPLIAPAHILAILDSVEGLSTRLPDNTADCTSLALDYQAAIGRVAALEAENKILKTYINGDVTEVEEIMNVRNL